MHNIYKNLSNDQLQKLIDPYLRVYNLSGRIKSNVFPRFLRLIDEKLRRNEC